MRRLTAFVRCRGYNGLHFTRGTWRGGANFDRIFREQLPSNWVGDWILGKKLRHILAAARRRFSDGRQERTYPFIGLFTRSAGRYTLTPVNSMFGGTRARQRMNPP